MSVKGFLASALGTLGHLDWHLRSVGQHESNSTLTRDDLLTIIDATREFPSTWRIETRHDEGGEGIASIMLRPDKSRSVPAFEISRHDAVVMVRVCRECSGRAGNPLVFGAFASVVSAAHAIYNEVIAQFEGAPSA